MAFLSMRTVGIMIGFTAVSAASMQAQSLTGNVGSAGITDDERGLEVRIGVNDDGDLASRAHYDYAFTGWYKLRVIAGFSQPDGGDWDYTGITFENWLQWREEAADTSSFNGGLRFAYEFADDGGPDEAELRLAITDKFGDGWEWRTNAMAEFEAGDGSEGGAELEARLQLTRGIGLNAFGTERWRLGGEIFSEFGNTRDIPGFEDQAHQIGPVIKASWDNDVYIQSAIRFGLTDASDGAMMKFFIGRDF